MIVSLRGAHGTLRYALSLFLAVGFVLLLSVPPASAADKVVLQLRWEPQFQFAGYYAALWRGYYAEAGLDVEIRSAVRPDGKVLSAIREVADGRAHFGIGAADVLVACDKGTHLTVVSGIFQHSPVAVIARKDADILSPGDLTRVRFRRFAGDIPDIELIAMLTAEGIDPAALKAYFHEAAGQKSIDLMAAGQLDAYVGYPLTANWQAKQNGVQITTLRPASYGVDFYGDSLFTSEGLAKQNPEMVKRFVKASLRGWKYALEHADEIATRIGRDVPRTFKVGDAVAFNRLQAREVIRLVQHPEVPLGQINPHRWQSMHGHLRRAGLVTNDFDMRRFLFDPRQGVIETQRSWITGLAVALGITVVLALAVLGLTWTIFLRRKVVARTAALTASEERYRTLVETMRDGLGVMDETGTITYVNDRACEMLGYTREEMQGRKVTDLLISDDEARAEFKKRMRLGEAGVRTPYEIDFTRKDGKKIAVLASPQPVFDADGTYRGVFVVVTDVTQLKTTQEALRESDERFRLILDNAASAVQLKDLDGRYLVVNKKFQSMLGVAYDEIIGKKSRDFFFGPQADKIEEMDRQALDKGMVVVWDFEQVLPDGRKIIEFVRKFPVLNKKGEAVGVATIAADVSEQRKLEEQLAHSQKMEAVGQLTGGIAHDFNNLLAIILGSAELLKSRSTDNHDLIDRIRRAGDRGAELTHRLLAYSRRQPLQPIVVNVNDLVKDTGKTLERMLGETITVDISPSASLWPTVADPGQLENVILNLAINARDAMPIGGALSIRTLNVSLNNAEASELDGCLPGDYVLLTVTDTGTGMAPDVLQNAFDPFFTTKDVGAGSGLGLSMVYGFAKQSRGAAGIESLEGQGTTVKLYLPRANQAEAAETRNDRDIAVAKKRDGTVLVVEDDPDVRELTVTLLESLGYHTLQAEDGPSALACLRENSGIDLLFTDIVLPRGMSGSDIAREAAHIRPDLKVVFTSGYPDKDFNGARSEADDAMLVRKPYLLSDLADALDTAMNA